MLCNIFFKAYRYKDITFCIKLFATETLKTSNITGNFTNFIRFLLFERTQILEKLCFRFDVFRFLKKWSWIIRISIYFLFRGTCIGSNLKVVVNNKNIYLFLISWHMYQRGTCIGSNLMFFLLSYFLLKMVSVMNKPHCGKKVCHWFDKTN